MGFFRNLAENIGTAMLEQAQRDYQSIRYTGKYGQNCGHCENYNLYNNRCDEWKIKIGEDYICNCFSEEDDDD